MNNLIHQIQALIFEYVKRHGVTNEVKVARAILEIIKAKHDSTRVL